MNNKKRIEDCAAYIDLHIRENLSTAQLAEKFNYSASHFKRRFREYYKMSVVDYIRTVKFRKAGKEIQQGMSCKEVAKRYGFHSYAGFSRAFLKEYPVPPTVYKNGIFETIRAGKYIKENQGILEMSILKLQPIQIKARKILQGNGRADTNRELDYWQKHGYPCGECFRLSCNIAQREDKIALWYIDEKSGDRDYYLGSVLTEIKRSQLEAERAVNSSLEDESAINLEGGHYAIFQTEVLFDDEAAADTLKLLTEAVIGGWMKDNSEQVDETRFVFERFFNRKVYLYVPVKQSEILI